MKTQTSGNNPGIQMPDYKALAEASQCRFPGLAALSC